ncbi:arylsulfatase B-like [Babylonia areolata]|uniref:arylsulfatase B-like n=1 Tax=Babylonia areolata TaxID=304850 RepID=UPI003FD2A955
MGFSKLTSAALLLMVTCFLFRESRAANTRKLKPNILFILMDDLGWNDLGVYDPNMVTPNIDKLYREGFRLNYSYTDPVGSSSRASLFSGKFSFRMGLQDGAINKYTDAHVPLNHTLLPESLKYRGYKTHMIGKWGQGFCNLDQTPTYRGFDTFFGHYTGKVDYTTKKTEEGYYDFRDGEEVMANPDYNNMYNTDVLGKRAISMINSHKRKFPNNENPFFIMLSFTAIQGRNQVPYKYIRKCRKNVFTSRERKQKCGMMAAVDLSIYRIMRALEETKQDENTVVIFTSDNGGDAQLGSSNWPLRGSKGSVWEGGVRVPTFLWSAGTTVLPVQNHTYTAFFHVVDWYPTLIGFAKKRGRPNWPLKIAPAMDGINHWRLIKRGVKKSFRREWGYLVTEGDTELACVRQGDYKLVVKEEKSPGWYRPPIGVNATDLEEPELDYERRPFLMFNIRKDPSETRDLSKSKVDKIVEAREGLLDLYEDYKADYLPKQGQVVDSSPANHPEYNDVWSPGSC